MNLGIKEKMQSPVQPVSTQDAEKKDRVVFPSFSIRDEHADDFRKEYDCEVGMTGTATIKFKVIGDAKDSFSNRVELEVNDIDISDTAAEDDADGDDAETKALGYKRPKAEKEAPDTSAKSLEE